MATRHRQASRTRTAGTVVVAVCLGLALWGMSPTGGSAEVRIGGGLGMADGAAVPMGRLAVDAISLWFVSAGFDAQVWGPRSQTGWLLPFVTVRTPLLVEAEVGLAPIVSLTGRGLRLAPDRVALKVGLQATVGPLGLFGQAVFVTPAAAVPTEPAEVAALGRPLFATGLVLVF